MGTLTVLLLSLMLVTVVTTPWQEAKWMLGMFSAALVLMHLASRLEK